MFRNVHPAAPVRVRVDREYPEGLLLAFIVFTGRSVVGVVVTCWRAPFLACSVGAMAALVWLFVAGRALTVAGVLVGLCAVVVVVWRVRPSWLSAVLLLVAGQFLRIAVYRPRWATACLASGAVARVGGSVYVPALVRHAHPARGRDTLTVRMAPGQTIATWRDASASIASSLTAHSVAAHPAGRPGWVVLDVLRRDPLAGERAAPDPARAARSLPSRSGSRTAIAAHDSSSGALVVVGRDEYGLDVAVDPYSTAHVGMQGATRSGKSSTCYTLLAALAHRPNVVVAGIDPSGLLLDPFTSGLGGRGAAFIATGTRAADIERAGAVLAGLVALMDSRVRDLRVSGRDKLDGYTCATPAVWCVMEEYPGLLSAAKALDAETGRKPGDRLAPRLESALGRLVKEGAKVGVLVLVLAQRMSADALRTDDRMNLGLRITLRVDNGDAVGMLHDGLTRDHVSAVRDFAPGVALVEEPGRGVRRVRMHWTGYDAYRSRVAAGITATASAPTLDIDGTARADILGEVVSMTTVNGARASTREETAA